MFWFPFAFYPKVCILPRHAVLAATVLLALSACTSTGLVARNSAHALKAPVVASQPTLTARYDIDKTFVFVSAPLSDNPDGSDILLGQGDAASRTRQAQSLLASAFDRATRAMTRGRAAVIEARVTRFDLTPQGTTVRFVMTVRDRTTGRDIEGPRSIVADLPRLDGLTAVAARNRAVRELARVIRAELSDVRIDPAPVSRGRGPIALTPGRLLSQSPIPL